MVAIEPGDVGEYTRRDTSHVDPAMRPTKADYDRYIFLVQRGRRLGWDDAAQAKDAPFQVAEPGMGFILLRANRDLAALAEALGADRAEIDGWTTRLEAGARALWNDAAGHYDSRDVRSGAWTGALTSAAFLCWYAGLPEPRMLPHLDRILAEVAFPVPSLAPWDARFEGLRYWRGPTWGIVNTMIGIGLAEQGLTSQAETLRARTEALLSQHGFAEYFDPLDGTPAGGGTFTWTAAIWLAWVRAGGT